MSEVVADGSDPLQEGSNDPNSTSVDGSNDPFDPANIGAVQVIMLLRIYDVMSALLAESNPDVAKEILRMHLDGTTLGPVPTINGVFMTNSINEDQ